MAKLTNPQREWLERFAKETWAVVDIASGGVSQLVTRLQNKGLLEVVRMDDWRDSYYVVTAAGRAALQEAGR